MSRRDVQYMDRREKNGRSEPPATPSHLTLPSVQHDGRTTLKSGLPQVLVLIRELGYMLTPFEDTRSEGAPLFFFSSCNFRRMTEYELSNIGHMSVDVVVRGRWE